MKKTSVHTILFTEECPVSCRYCHLKDQEGYGCNPMMTKEEVFARVAEIDKQDDPEKINSRILFTGGEPFLYFPWIKEVMLKYGDRFQYAFNTSGVMFTNTMLDFLSNYKVSFVLSVDGGERLTNYLRPLNVNKYGVGYFKRLKKILPRLLYHFPEVPFRIIINSRYVDILYDQYLEAEQAGFRGFCGILDFEQRPSQPLPGKKSWNDSATQVLRQQYMKIAEEFLLGLEAGVWRPRLVDVEKAMTYILRRGEGDFTPDQLQCRVFDGRSNYTVGSGTEKAGYCMSATFPDINDFKKAMEEEYAERTKDMTPDKKLAFDYLCTHGCPKNGYDATGKFYDFEELEFIYHTVCYEVGLALLQIGTETLSENPLFQEWIKGLVGKGCCDVSA